MFDDMKPTRPTIENETQFYWVQTDARPKPWLVCASAEEMERRAESYYLSHPDSSNSYFRYQRVIVEVWADNQPSADGCR